MWGKSPFDEKANTGRTNRIVQVQCFSRIMSMSEFTEQTSQQLCVNFEFVQALGLCLEEGCDEEEIEVVKDAAIKQCDINPGDYRPTLRAASLIIFGFALLCYCMRLLSKFLHRSNWGADDTFMSLAAFLIVPLLVLFLLMISHGVGLDLRTLSREQVVFIFKMFFVQQVTYFITLGFVKASVLAFYLRIFPDHKFRIAVWITQSINLAVATLYAILILLQKKPISLNWTVLSEGVKAVLWAYIELCMGVVVGCMPNIRQLTRRAHKFLVSRSGHGSSDPEANTGDFRERSLELISQGTTAVGTDKGKSGTVSSISK
ncbi:unnamed protein product [Fusarium equiseti]|uniref:Rhodopsin domain-containing protein n=1 Tax=Fusarium equiseti TaxID=61235 RepID=A0A8J2NGV1_FUSEQ|nr:unnamed protein product [Fusarium equiseti]